MQTFIQPQIHRFETTRHKEKQCNWLDWLSSDDLDVGQTNKQEATVQSLKNIIQIVKKDINQRQAFIQSQIHRFDPTRNEEEQCKQEAAVYCPLTTKKSKDMLQKFSE